MHCVYVVDSAEVPHAPEVVLEQEVLEGCATVERLLLERESELAPYAESASAIILWHHLPLTRALSRNSRKPPSS